MNKVKHTHRGGVRKHELYYTFYNMIQRCYNPNNPDYKHYGGRGIKVCDRWLEVKGFLNFIEDVGVKPKGKSLDRIDNNADYSKENCRWSTQYEQSRNKRNNNNHPGVVWDKGRNCYRAQIRINKKETNLGRFVKLEDAIFAHKKAYEQITQTV
jgi:hypothetical protein